MRILLFLGAILVAYVSTAQEVESNAVSTSCLEHKDMFSFSHCIKKRQTNDCTNSNCNCSTGNCCSSGNCCNNGNCNNVCASNTCCSTSSCNTCATGCMNNCQNTQCRQNCVQNCKEPEKPEAPVPVPGGNNTVNVNNKIQHVAPVNISTVINLKNYILNKNIVSAPINITNVVRNYINETSGKSQDLKEIVINVVTNKSEPIVSEKCCYVIHPIHCHPIHTAPYVRCFQRRHWECSSICTSVVVNLVHVKEPVLVQVPVEKPIQVPVPVPIPQPPMVINRVQQVPVGVPVHVPVVQHVPVIQQQLVAVPTQQPIARRCHYIPQYPWVQCSHFGVQNCGSCYVCGGNTYNPGVCRTKSACPDVCRSSALFNDPGAQDKILQYASMYQSPPVPQQAQNIVPAPGQP